MNTNYLQMPYESDYSEDVGTKMSSLPFGQSQRVASMPMMNMPGQGMNMMQLPMGGGMPQMSSLPMTTMGQIPSYPLQGNVMQPQTMPMMQSTQGQGQASLPVSMPTMTQLPPGAVTPLSSMTMMPMMSGGIDGGGMNVVVPDLQPLSMNPTNHHMTQLPHLTQIPQIQQPQHNNGRLTGGGSGGNSTNWMNYNSVSNGSQMVPNNMYNYQPQSYPSMHNLSQQLPQQQQHHHHQQQQQQQQQQQHRMKSQYDYSNNSNNYREARNGLNSPTMQDSMRYSRNSEGKKAAHWR